MRVRCTRAGFPKVQEGIVLKKSLILAILLAAGGLFMFKGESQAQPFGQFLEFTGPGTGYVEIPHNAALNPTGAITIEAWLYLRSYGCSGIVGKDYFEAYWLGEGCDGGKLRFYPQGGVSEDGTGDIPLNQWVHVAVTYDSTTLNFYINGELDRTTTDISGPLTSSTDPVRIGNDVSWDYSPDGYIDEVRIWNRALTQGEIQATMDTAITSAQPGLVAVWHLDGNADDAIGGYDGSLVGDVEFVTRVTFEVEEQLGDCADVTNIAWSFDNQAKEWKSFSPGEPDFLQTLTEFTAGGGYFINLSGNCTINSGSNTFNLYTGWNLFGWQ